MEVLHTVIAIALAIVLIIRFTVDPVISLTISCLYLGLAAGVGLTGTIEEITGGFGDIMVEVGLLIGFGVLIGALLHATGTFTDLVAIIARRVGGKLPYAMSGTLATIFPSIYVDVQVVLAAPMARASAGVVDKKYGLPWLAGGMGIGIFAGYVFVVPGLAAVAVAGLLDVSLGRYLVFGLPIGLATALLTTWLFRVALRSGKLWNPATDLEEDEPQEGRPEEGEAIEGQPSQERGDHGPTPGSGSGPADRTASGTEVGTGTGAGTQARPALVVRMLPILVPLVLIAFGAFADLLGFSTSVIAFLGDPNVALFGGLLIAFVLARRILGGEESEAALSTGFQTTGEILLITGIGGSLGAVIAATGLDQTLGNLFSADAGSPVVVSVLLAWFIAAVLHFAIGSVSVGAITAAGIIAPVVSSTGVDPVVIALSIASGAMFALHVNSNFFWMFKSLLGISTQGALKTLTLATSLGAVVSLPMVFVAAALVGLG